MEDQNSKQKRTKHSHKIIIFQGFWKEFWEEIAKNFFLLDPLLRFKQNDINPKRKLQKDKRNKWEDTLSVIQMVWKALHVQTGNTE